jgi:hypothetical protein
VAEVQADEADVQFFHSAIAKKWGLCLWDKDCPEGEACAKHHCEVRAYAACASEDLLRDPQLRGARAPAWRAVARCA